MEEATRLLEKMPQARFSSGCYSASLCFFGSGGDGLNWEERRSDNFVIAYAFTGGRVDPQNTMELLREIADADIREKDELAAQERELENQRKLVEAKLRKKKDSEARLMKKVLHYLSLRLRIPLLTRRVTEAAKNLSPEQLVRVAALKVASPKARAAADR